MEHVDVMLVDGSSYLYRAFHALPPMTTPDGTPTHVVFGVVNMLSVLLKQYTPQYLAVVFDAPGKTFRHDMYADYKANRPSMPDELRVQIPPLHAIITALGVPLVSVDGVEADDVIATFVADAERHGRSVIVVTGDKDLAQLVTGRLTLVDTMKNTVLDVAGVERKFGVPPERIVDYLALVGDASDNIPGVPKVGPKTAVKWLQAYGDVAGVIKHADAIPGAVGEQLRTHIAQLQLSYQLAEVRRDCELPLALSSLTRRPRDTAALRDWYTKLHFRSWLAREFADNGEDDVLDPLPPPAATSPEYTTVTDIATLKRLVVNWQRADCIAFDTETTGLDAHSCSLVGVAISDAPGRGWYIPLRHVDAHGKPVVPQIAVDDALSLLRPLLTGATPAKTAQNGKFDRIVLANAGIEIDVVCDDTMLAAWVLNSQGRHGLDTLAKQYLQRDVQGYTDVVGTGRNAKRHFGEVTVEAATRYAAEDAEVTRALHTVFAQRLADEPALDALYRDIELPLLPVLQRMEQTGIRIDVDELARQSDAIAIEMEQTQQRAYQLAGIPFNINSPKQIGEILFTRLELPVVKKTPSGQPSTDESVLEQLAVDHDIAAVIVRYRGLGKLKSTYLDALRDKVNATTGRVHTTFHQTGTITGRLSSSDPNLQNIPIRTEEGARVRAAFVPDRGYRLLTADYSQIELRIMAHLSGDDGLCTAFRAGRDIHAATAADIFHVPLADVTSLQRRFAKTINFGLIYGMSAFGLARQLGVPQGEAKDYIDRYFARFTGVKHYMDQMRALARERGWVETLFGRRLYLPGIRDKNYQQRQHAERAAINAPMQGTAADIIKKAMLAIDARRLPARMVLQVHDELLFEVPEDNVDAITAAIRDGMTTVTELQVPLVVNIGVGDNWQQAK